MGIDSIYDSIEILDEEKIYVISYEKWMKLIQYNYKLDIMDSMIPIITKLMEFSNKYNDFSVGFSKGGAIGWVATVLYNYDKEIHRVQLENGKCKKCEWSGIIANPTDVLLFINVKNNIEIMRKAWELPMLGCPICNEKLERPAIWVEPIEK